ncbi:D-2-hydroxyacid dehydrogenase family protein [Arthrobacter sp. KNU-44]|uniref:D-2-hydroxyacid dehydrogenase family protein n=1 Tax=Arthrobacter sp. KNU-44 TaxID=3450744 RepID=UPI003F431252
MTGRPRVAVINDYLRIAPSMADWDRIGERARVEFLHEPFRDEDDAANTLRPFEVLCVMRERLPLTRSLFERLPHLKCVITTGRANRAIDLQAAEDAGVLVLGTANGEARLATAELTWALILAAARRIPQEDRAVRGGKWQTSLGTALHGKTLGLIGLGGVGSHVAKYAHVFGMKVLAWSPRLEVGAALKQGAVRVELEELLCSSDVISVHMVLTEQTRGLIGEEELSLMRPGAVLVNTSRGPLVDERALVAALRTKSIGGAALDVFEEEPLSRDHPFLGLDNVILSPHVGGFTDDVYREWYAGTVEGILGYLDGEPIRVISSGGFPDDVARAQ